MSQQTISPEQRHRIINRTTIVGSIVNLLLLVFKFIAGIIGNSSAMIADAVHSLSDFFSDIIVLAFVKVSVKPGDADHDYGHAKFETLASLIIGVTLAIVGVALLIEGTSKTINFFRGNSLPTPGAIALIAAAVSIVAKESLYHYTRLRARSVNSPALLANAWHHRSDALTSVATLLGVGGAFLLGPSWAVLDPLAAAIVSIFILKAAYTLIRPSIDELLEKALPPEEKARIAATILSTPGIIDMHRLRTRNIGSYKAVDAHIKMDGSLSLEAAHAIATDAENRIRALLGNGTIVTLHMEPIGPSRDHAH